MVPRADPLRNQADYLVHQTTGYLKALDLETPRVLALRLSARQSCICNRNVWLFLRETEASPVRVDGDNAMDPQRRSRAGTVQLCDEGPQGAGGVGARVCRLPGKVLIRSGRCS